MRANPARRTAGRGILRSALCGWLRRRIVSIRSRSPTPHEATTNLCGAEKSSRSVAARGFVEALTRARAVRIERECLLEARRGRRVLAAVQVRLAEERVDACAARRDLGRATQV